MSVIHRTTLVPAKLELLAPWLTKQPWYVGQAGLPQLTNAGGFRLDDPDGEVGIEFMIVLDAADGGATAYLVPMTYRGSALPGAESELIGLAEHGVLGERWIYDGTRDPVLVAQLIELIQGRAEAQAQSESDTIDPTVLSRPVLAAPGQQLDVQVSRVLTPAGNAESADAGIVTGLWMASDGAQIRSVFASARPTPG